ncbi:hypothetical protein L1987_48672 [Smallanthus sonchifolius]|uniref:Uncharacterized protein n=1 Tax=Smallanthus sonchifolius TaxID=185202 RepID=A0ACB9FRZ2_9ASTR|nr:hypothetical protein L1987_48672 [Smallanthus sonchifolius]
MYILSVSHKRVNILLVSTDKTENILCRFEEFPGPSLSYLGVNSSRYPVVPNCVDKESPRDCPANLPSPDRWNGRCN